MRVLITGGRGFLGANLASGLLARGHQVVLLDSLAVAHARREPPAGAELVEGDVTDRNSIDAALQAVRPDAVVHAAAVVGGALSIADPALTARVNVEGTVNVLQSMLEAGVERGFQISTEEAYGDFRSERITEDHPLQPGTPYGITKIAAEAYADYYRARHGVNMVAVRTSWTYGPGFPRPRGETPVIRDALRTGTGRAEHGADQLIDYTYIDDWVDGMTRLVEAPSLRHTAYNLSSGTAVRLADLATLLERLIPGAEISFGPGLLEHAPGWPMPQKGALDITRAREEVGYQPRVSLEEGMRRYVEALRAELE